MPAIANLPPQIVCVRPADDAFGMEAFFVSEAAAKASRHWEDRAGYILSQQGEPDAFGYKSIPLVPTASVRVSYRFAGELEPMPYEWDD